jgi:hypothetical protein
MDVHRAARVMAVANGGQVLLTEDARRACGRAVEVRDLGYHRLKDLPAPEHLVQLLVPGVGSRFAPLRSLNRSNLPSRPTRWWAGGQRSRGRSSCWRRRTGGWLSLWVRVAWERRG